MPRRTFDVQQVVPEEDLTACGGFLPPDEPSCSALPSRDRPLSNVAATDATDRVCQVCAEDLPFSFLTQYFDLSVCDACRQSDAAGERKYMLLTRTDAKEEYLLKDCDINSREPRLRYVARKNPHNHRWGDMKLYCKWQVEERAREVHGDLGKIKEMHEKRDENRKRVKAKQFSRKIKQMRKETRSQFGVAKDAAAHVHTFRDGTPGSDDDGDAQRRVCTDCGFVDVFETM